MKRGNRKKCSQRHLWLEMKILSPFQLERQKGTGGVRYCSPVMLFWSSLQRLLWLSHALESKIMPAGDDQHFAITGFYFNGNRDLSASPLASLREKAIKMMGLVHRVSPAKICTFQNLGDSNMAMNGIVVEASIIIPFPIKVDLQWEEQRKGMKKGNYPHVSPVSCLARSGGLQ
ncbi:hypothetical protein C5167_034308 [Papaver somniferum]|uniref:Uncharacterized protein n=1 Tax=Papaver somniferum TaxID=3469 RepID=A0A4Y7K8N4_PAPSO|nr:hypothetical protein C5167_034308 [Papaver somniferum]